MLHREPTHFSTPLDLDPDLKTKREPALTWLIAYGAYTLLIRFVYSFIMPLMTSLFASDQSDISDFYEKMNLVFTLGNIALSVAIIIKINNMTCRIIFAITILINFYAMISALFLNKF